MPASLRRAPTPIAEPVTISFGVLRQAHQTALEAPTPDDARSHERSATRHSRPSGHATARTLAIWPFVFRNSLVGWGSAAQGGFCQRGAQSRPTSGAGFYCL